MRLLTAFALVVSLAAPVAADPARLVDQALSRHVLPGFAILTQKANELAAAAETDCKPEAASLREAYGNAFDAWLGVSHLRFGPTEVDSRGFALAFWPDPRSKASKALRQLILAEDPIVTSPDDFTTLSVAARGFYALERMLYDPGVQSLGTEGYRCQLTIAIARDIALTSALIEAEWIESYAPLMRAAGPGNATYATPREAVKELFKSASSGLQFTSELRLGRPLGTFDRPRPKRAEARLSERSLTNAVLSVEANGALADILSQDYPQIDIMLAEAVELIRAQAGDLDPVFAMVSAPSDRIKVEIFQQSINEMRVILGGELGPALGVSQGFNALDGD
ncbi:MAG: imelysin family protein [Pseudomonadota bacterium]